MEESQTPFLIVDAINASGAAVLWVWVSFLLGAVLVLLGAVAFCS